MYFSKCQTIPLRYRRSAELKTETSYASITLCPGGCVADVTTLTSRKDLVTAVLCRLREAEALHDNTLQSRQTTERWKLPKSCHEDCFLEEMKAPAAAGEARFNA